MEPQEPQKHPEGSLEAKVVGVLKTCYDPEIPVDIYELGLIYTVEIQDIAPAGAPDAAVDAAVEPADETPVAGKKALVTMTLTSPACPVAGSLPGEVQRKILAQIDELSDSHVEITWDPPWTVDRMSEAAKLQLGMM
ncbi:MAG: iron-sulfur cluster assembly protein [bacterium]|nr:iron-sulfur cluster assembly protein [bacterium]